MRKKTLLGIGAGVALWIGLIFCLAAYAANGQPEYLITYFISVAIGVTVGLAGRKLLRYWRTRLREEYERGVGRGLTVTNTQFLGQYPIPLYVSDTIIGYVAVGYGWIATQASRQNQSDFNRQNQESLDQRGQVEIVVAIHYPDEHIERARRENEGRR